MESFTHSFSWDSIYNSDAINYINDINQAGINLKKDLRVYFPNSYCKEFISDKFE